MTKDQQATLEQVAREWLKKQFGDRIYLTHDVHALVDLLASQRAEGLEETAKMAEAKADRARLKSAEQYNQGYRGGLCGFASELRQLAREQRL